MILATRCRIHLHRNARLDDPSVTSLPEALSSRWWHRHSAGLTSASVRFPQWHVGDIGQGWSVTTGWKPLVLGGGRYATSGVQAFVEPLSGRYLSLAEREEIALLLVQGHGVCEIARRLSRAASTVSREIRRNAATRNGNFEYRATTAQWHAERAARRPKVAWLAANDTLRCWVEDRLREAVAKPGHRPVTGPRVSWKGRRHGPRQNRRWSKAWSPEQIARRLPIDFPDDHSMRISHEAIYQALFGQGRGALRRDLTACLRSGRALRVPRARVGQRGKGFVSPEIMISERPVEADDRAVPGYWEGDLILGIGSSAIGTPVERKTRFTMLLHLPRMEGRGAGPVIKN